MSSYEMKTINGYLLLEVASALQKSIRRGDEEQAMFWAVELHESNYSEYLWKRIKIISSEDIGLAEPNISANIYSLYQMYIEIVKNQKKNPKNKKTSERQFITHAILMMCRAKKSRLNDWTLIHYWRTHNTNLIPIPDYALDKHTKRGRIMKRGWKHFFEIGTLLNNHKELDKEDVMKEKAKEILMHEQSETLFND